MVEAVLFTMGKSVELRQLAIATGQSEEETRQAVERLKVRYDKEERGHGDHRAGGTVTRCVPGPDFMRI